LNSRLPSVLIAGLLVGLLSLNALALERFPPPEFETDYVRPTRQAPLPRSAVFQLLDCFVLASALGLSSYLVLKRRNRSAVLVLALFSLAYFGFYRKGCICPIGAIQNVSLALFNSGYAVPLSVLFFFLAPLAATLFFGRSFCAAVCPFGALQEITLLRPIVIPPWLEHALRYLAYMYLALAVWLASMGSTFIICRYDPYVAIFRRNGNLDILILGAALLVIGLFVGRPYCRFLCPLGVILRQFSRLSKWRVRITPDACIQCKLCEDACPYGAIQSPVPEWPAETYAADKRRLAMLLVLLPALISLGAWFGHHLAPVTARTHPAVALAERIWQEEEGLAEGTTDASQVFRTSGEPISSLYERAAAIRERFGKSGWFFGGFLGLVLGGKLILLSLRRPQRDYEADRAACVSCARCYRYCPRDHGNFRETEIIADSSTLKTQCSRSSVE